MFLRMETTGMWVLGKLRGIEDGDWEGFCVGEIYCA